MALRVLQTLEILAGSLSEGRVVSHAILDGRVDPAGLSVEVAARVGGGDRLHHDEPPASLWVIPALSQLSLHSDHRNLEKLFLTSTARGTIQKR